MKFHKVTAIKQFLEDVGGYAEVRGRKTAQMLKKYEVRSKKHNMLAVKWDELGNCFCLCNDGMRRQLTKKELFSGKAFY